MKRNDNPSTVFEQISSIKNRYSTSKKKTNKDDLVVVVLDAVPQEYQAVLMAIQMQLKAALTLQDLQIAMNAHWRSVGSNHSDKRTSEDNRMVLSAFKGF
jgi:hypothetical protein